MTPVNIRAHEILSRLGANPRGVELGVFTGALSSRLLVRKDLHLTMVDSWGQYRPGFAESGDYHATNTAEQQARNKATAEAVTAFADERRDIVESDTVAAASSLEGESLDFVFVDADHTYEGCRDDILAWWPKIKPGGLLAGHDYAHPQFPKWGVDRAVTEFAAREGLDVDLGEDWTWFIRKDGPRPSASEHYDSVIFACVKWGMAYGPEYVNVLADMVARNCAIPYRFICLTDDPAGLSEGIETLDLPRGLTGWWNKIALFKPGMFPAQSRIVYLDLDVVVVGPLEDLIDAKGIAHDWLQGGYNSSVMVWDAGEHLEIWDAFDPQTAERLHGDQDWIQECSVWPYLPADWVPSYRLHSIEWPPLGSKVVAFHGQPKPHQVTDGWVPTMWTMAGLAVPRMTSVLNNDIEEIRRNVEANKANSAPPIELAEAHDRELCIVGGGPSLADSLVSLQLLRAKGAETWALNGAHDWLIDRGVKPDGMVMLDSRKENVEPFLSNPRSHVTYYIATQCDPSAFEALAGSDVRKWTGWFWGVEDKVVIGGGATVGLKALCLAYVLGYRRLKLFGYDSSYRNGENHAYRQAMNDAELTAEVVVQGQRFTAARWMIKQVREFQELARTLMGMGCEIEIFGDGLLPHVCRVSERAGETRKAS